MPPCCESRSGMRGGGDEQHWGRQNNMRLGWESYRTEISGAFILAASATNVTTDAYTCCTQEERMWRQSHHIHAIRAYQRTKQDKARQDKTRQDDKTRHGKTQQDTARHGKTRDKTRDKASQGKASQVKSSQVKSSQVKSSQVK